MSDNAQETAYHYYAEANIEPGQTHASWGVVTTTLSPFDAGFLDAVTKNIAGHMQPPRPFEIVAIRSLTPLASRRASAKDKP